MLDIYETICNIIYTYRSVSTFRPHRNTIVICNTNNSCKTQFTETYITWEISLYKTQRSLVQIPPLICYVHMLVQEVWVENEIKLFSIIKVYFEI